MDKKSQNFYLKKLFFFSFYYTIDVYPYQPTYQEFICTHLFLFVIICDFLSLYENKQAYEYDHLKQIFYHQKQIMRLF